jgi:isocitrate dehydrogenase
MLYFSSLCNLAICIKGNKFEHGTDYLYTEEFIDAVAEKLVG